MKSFNISLYMTTYLGNVNIDSPSGFHCKEQLDHIYQVISFVRHSPTVMHQSIDMFGSGGYQYSSLPKKIIICSLEDFKPLAHKLNYIQPSYGQSSTHYEFIVIAEEGEEVSDFITYDSKVDVVRSPEEALDLLGQNPKWMDGDVIVLNFGEIYHTFKLYAREITIFDFGFHSEGRHIEVDTLDFMDTKAIVNGQLAFLSDDTSESPLKAFTFQIR